MAETGSAQAGAAGGADEAREAVRATSFLQRAVLRRRLRFLERRRELALHDLGGFVFESHRLGETRPELEAEKLAAVDTIDLELATLQHALDAREELAVLHEPGISSCPHCGTIHDSVARFCPGCGRPRGAGQGLADGTGETATAAHLEAETPAAVSAVAVEPTVEVTPEEVTAPVLAEPGDGSRADAPPAGAETDRDTAAEPAVADHAALAQPAPVEPEAGARTAGRADERT